MPRMSRVQPPRLPLQKLMRDFSTSFGMTG